MRSAAGVLSARKSGGAGRIRKHEGSQQQKIEYDRWVFGRLIEAGPTTLNMVINKMVPRGREVATPEVLRHLPLKPPGRG